MQVHHRAPPTCTVMHPARSPDLHRRAPRWTSSPRLPSSTQARRAPACAPLRARLFGFWVHRRAPQKVKGSGARRLPLLARVRGAPPCRCATMQVRRQTGAPWRTSASNSRGGRLLAPPGQTGAGLEPRPQQPRQPPMGRPMAPAAGARRSSRRSKASHGRLLALAVQLGPAGGVPRSRSRVRPVTRPINTRSSGRRRVSPVTLPPQPGPRRQLRVQARAGAGMRSS